MSKFKRVKSRPQMSFHLELWIESRQRNESDNLHLKYKRRIKYCFDGKENIGVAAVFFFFKKIIINCLIVFTLFHTFS